MNRLSAPLIAAVSVVAFTQFASAADLPRKAPVVAPPPPVFSWTGCYAGLNAGAARNNTDFTSVMSTGTHLGIQANVDLVSAAGTGSADEWGFVGGGQVGCNWQSGAFVFGIEGDFNAFTPDTGITGEGILSTGDTFAITNSVQSRWLATVRPRLGYAFDRSLLYITGGVAFGNFKYTQTYADTLLSGFGSSATTKTKTGWTIGAGWEYAFYNNWSAKIEYLYARFSSIDTDTLVVATSGGTNALHGSAEVHTNIVRVGLNYRFGGF